MAAFGIVCAIAVYAAIGERQSSAPPELLPRLDPRSIIESTGAAFQQFSAAKQEYVIEAERQLTYEGGATKFIGVTIKVKERGGRDFVISGREAQAGEGQKDLQVIGDVRLAASDGFVASTDHATFSDADATVRAAGPVSFQKGRMSGSGIGMSYDQSTDVLTLADTVRVAVTDEAGKTTMEFTSASATLVRAEDYLSLEGNVHALRGEQVLESDRGRALLSEDDDLVTFIELRGNARVVGGEAFESMGARDIDLDYSDMGDVLERVVLQGGGTVILAGEDDEGGRQFEGESLELMFAPDQTLTQATGRGGVRMMLPAAASAPSRTIKARSFDASGEPGKGLTAARFNDQVEFEEKGTTRRAARSAALRTTLSGQDVTSAVFTTAVSFEAEGLRASASEVQYDPAGGGLRLRGAEGGKVPRVSDEKIEIDADTIDVTIEGPRMVATGHVRTVLRPQAAGARGNTGGQAGGAQTTRLPGLLQQGQAANVSAGTLDYQGVAATAAYTGDAMLWQGDTTIRADAISLDQRKADLVAIGNGRSNLPLEGGVSIGRASEIRYDDAARRITFASVQPAVAASPVNSSGARPGAGAAAARSTTPAQLSGPQGDLRATRIEVVLAGAASRIDRLEAYRDVDVRLDTRVATGDRLTYFDADGRYVITGVATVPVTIVEECRETTGRTVTFFRSSERVIVDGNEEIRTQSRRGGSCPASTAP
ncbi:MAG: LPS export ABC transporter periplasmic protein LptC [Acidobacteria bacterium]|nr:LPS export ABC transporter periplasmic protein LptC [Acidobacteriota bacterium]